MYRDAGKIGNPASPQAFLDGVVPKRLENTGQTADAPHLVAFGRGSMCPFLTANLKTEPGNHSNI